MGIGLLIGGAVVALIGLILWISKNKKEGKSALISVTETSKISEINENFQSMISSMGNGNFTHFCEVKGVAHSDSPITSELAKKSCVYYSAKVVHEYEKLEERRDSNGRVTRNWVKKSDTVSDNTQWASGFGVKDETGFILIDPAKAEIHAIQVYSNFERDPHKDALLKFKIGGVSFGLGDTDPNRRTLGYRYTETAIPVNQNLYVLGDANDREGRLHMSKPKESRYPFIVSTKSESEIADNLGSSIKGLKIGAFICLGLGAGLMVFGVIKMIMP
ncbi:MAG: E3 ubiquitin ligase family protein [Crocinitomicaceae bacterium]|nr:E3 ubiquitin ligase family protein [Crocinitomicaceae bacterium]